jgi:ribonuclease R
MKQRPPKAKHNKALAPHKMTPNALPSDEDILATVRQHGHETAQRDLARLFALKGEERRLLRQKLRQMSDKGLLDRKGKRFSSHHEAPEIFVAIITHTDHHGELWLRPEDTAASNPNAVQQPPTRLVLPKTSGRTRPPAIGDRVLVKRAEGGRDHAPTAKWIKTLPKAHAAGPLRRIGVVKQSTDEGPKALFVHATSKRSRISQWPLHPHHTQKVKDGDLVVFEVDEHRRLGPGHARIKEILPNDATEHTITTIAIHEHGLRDVFPQDVLKEAQACKPVDLENREDWRDIPLITIDPSDAKDHDDAVYACLDTSPDNEGGFVVLVAIADVAAYVRAGHAMDKEALLRGNSVYFPTGVLPMLPERLANDLCSLKPHVDRPALAMRIVIDKNGRKKTQSLHRILMRSHGKLSYQEAQQAFDGLNPEICAPLWPSPLADLKKAHQALEQESASRGPLDLDLPERKLQLDAAGHVTSVITPPRLMAHKLIENMMILANVAAAELLEAKGIHTVYRTHANPSLEKVSTLRQVLSGLGINLQKTENLDQETSTKPSRRFVAAVRSPWCKSWFCAHNHRPCMKHKTSVTLACR